MKKEKMIEKACYKMCEFYCHDDGTCSLNCKLCHDDKYCLRRQNAKDLIDEIFTDEVVVFTKEELEKHDRNIMKKLMKHVIDTFNVSDGGLFHWTLGEDEKE